MDGRIPPRYRGKLIKDVDNVTVQTSLVSLLHEFERGSGAILSGSNGSGKTFAACAFVESLLQAEKIHRPAVFVPAEEVYRLSRGEHDDYRSQPWNVTLRTCECLLLDDLGKEDRGIDWKESAQIQAIGALLRYRNQSLRSTYITTNLGPSKFAETYGPSVASLLSEVGDVLFINLEDRRPNRR